jgi:hypothetical protein
MRERAGSNPAKYANPANPTAIIEKAIGILIRKRTKSNTIPTTPVVSGLIF